MDTPAPGVGALGVCGGVETHEGQVQRHFPLPATGGREQGRAGASVLSEWLKDLIWAGGIDQGLGLTDSAVLLKVIFFLSHAGN